MYRGVCVCVYEYMCIEYETMIEYSCNNDSLRPSALTELGVESFLVGSKPVWLHTYGSLMYADQVDEKSLSLVPRLFGGGRKRRRDWYGGIHCLYMRLISLTFQGFCITSTHLCVT